MRRGSGHGVDLQRRETLLAAFADHAELTQAGILCIGDDGREVSTSWAQVYARATRRAGWLVETCGVTPGARVGVALPEDARFVECVVAAWLAGAAAVPVARPGLLDGRALERAAHVVADAGVRVLLCAEEARGVFDGLDGASQIEGVGYMAPDAPAIERAARGEALALVQYTSGSSGPPKGVMISHASLAANCQAFTTSRGLMHDAPVMASWLPLHHDMGLVGEALAAARLGVPLVMMSPEAFLFDPGAFLSAMARHRVTMTHMPGFALAHCLRRVPAEAIARLDLSAVRAIFLGGEPVDARLVAAFNDAFGVAGLSPRALCGAYGLAEATVCISRAEPGDGFLVERVSREALADGAARPAEAGEAATLIPDVGPVLDGHEVRIVREDGLLYGDREVGEVWFRGPSVMDGYWGDEAGTREVMVIDEGGAWLRTGDLGFLVDRRLYICGRLKEVLILRGRNHSPEPIERAAEQVPGVRAGQVVAFSAPGARGEVAVVVAETDAPPEQHAALIAQVRAAVAEGAGVTLDHVTLAPPKTIPRTTSGKRQRRLTRARWIAQRQEAT